MAHINSYFVIYVLSYVCMETYPIDMIQTQCSYMLNRIYIISININKYVHWSYVCTETYHFDVKQTLYRCFVQSYLVGTCEKTVFEQLQSDLRT